MTIKILIKSTDNVLSEVIDFCLKLKKYLKVEIEVEVNKEDE